MEAEKLGTAALSTSPICLAATRTRSGRKTPADEAEGRVQKRGGRKKSSEAQPDLLPAVEAAIAQDTAGSPVDESLRWTNRSVPALAADQDQGFEIGVDALRRILLEELGLSRRAAFKGEAACHFPQRDEQFEYIAKLRARYEREGWPILSIDTKKKEILGNFFHPGRALTDGRVIVQDHDFVSASQRRGLLIVAGIGTR